MNLEQKREEKIESVAKEVEKYISKRPNAAETAEGVAKWWISRQRIEESIELVESALEYLVAEQKLIKQYIGNTALYSPTN